MSNISELPNRLRDPEVLLSILDNLPTSIFVKGQDLKFVFSNRIHCEMIGKPESELLGFSDADFYDSEVAKDFIDRDQSVIESGIVSRAEEMASRQDGMTMPVLTRKARLVGPDGKTYLIGTNSDLTEIKKREEQYRALAETVPVGVMQIEETGVVAFANALSIAYLGLESSPATLSSVQYLFADQSADFPGKAMKFEVDILVDGSTSRRILVISSGWLNMANKMERSAIVSLVDLSEMTELRRINNEISRLNAELAQNMKRLKDAQDELVKKGRLEQLGQLTATVAHELRNPLGAVRTSTFLLDRKLSGKGLGVETQLQRIANGVVRCDNIITQLLDFSRTKLLVCKPGNLDEWLESVVLEEKQKIPSFVILETKYQIGSIATPFDPERLQRAIINLLSNATEAIVEKQSPDAKLILSTGMRGDRVYIRVQDNGPGMGPEVLGKIREPLFTTKSFGTGLGVPAIEQIVKQHGGDLEIESKLGEGATFTIWLPVENAIEDAA